MSFQVSTSTTWTDVMSFQVACNKTHKKETKKKRKKKKRKRNRDKNKVLQNCSGDRFSLIIETEYFCTAMYQCAVLGI